MNEVQNCLMEEIGETGGIERTIATASGSFSDSPKSTDVTLSVFINASSGIGTYFLRFTHNDAVDGVISSVPAVAVDKEEKYLLLHPAVCRFVSVAEGANSASEATA